MKQLINAPIKFTNSMQEAINFAPYSKVLYVGEAPDVPTYFIRVPSLLPPVEAAYAEMNNDMNGYNYIYTQYLNTSEIVRDIKCQILGLLHNGEPVIVYIQDGNELAVGQFLPTWFYTTMGLYDYEKVHATDQYGNKYFPYYDTEYAPVIASYLYTYGNGLIDAQEFLLNTDDKSLYQLYITLGNTSGVNKRLDIDFRLDPKANPIDKYNYLISLRNKYFEFYINPVKSLDPCEQVSPFELSGEAKEELL